MSLFLVLARNSQCNAIKMYCVQRVHLQTKNPFISSQQNTDIYMLLVYDLHFWSHQVNFAYGHSYTYCLKNAVKDVCSLRIIKFD